MAKAPDSVFMCSQHQFVVEVTLKSGTVDCHRSPKHRVAGCAECDEAVDDAFALVGWGDHPGRRPEGS